MTVRIARISEEPLDLAAHLEAVSSSGVGAVTTFIGTVRDADPDAAGTVVALEYTAHPDAEATLRRLAEEAIRAVSAPERPSTGSRAAGAGETEDPTPGDLRIAVSHRTGRLGVGDYAVVIVVASGHRDASFVACRVLIESIKAELPVWKRQVEADGTTAWKGLGG